MKIITAISYATFFQLVAFVLINQNEEIYWDFLGLAVSMIGGVLVKKALEYQ